MDRDMVNCLHYLYQFGQLTPQQLNGTAWPGVPFWCAPDTRHPLQGRGIVAEDPGTGALTLTAGALNLVDMVEDQLRSMPKADYAFGYPISAAIRRPGDPRPAFLAISYAPEFEPVKAAVLEVARSANFACEVTGDLGAPGVIMDQVWQGIRAADAVVADIAGSNPNVFYEIGLAHALGKEVILLSREGDAPFDIRASRRIVYDPGEPGRLRSDLALAFAGVSARYPFEGPEPRY